MTPEEALRLAKTIADLYGEATTALVQAVARALARGVDAPDLLTRQLADTLRLRDDTRRIVARLQAATRTEIPGLLEQVYAAQAGQNLNPRSVVALAEDTVRVLDSTGPRILRWTEDTYRRAVAEATGPAIAGAVTRRDAAATVLDRLTRSGSTGFTDAAGRRWSLESYAEMATRTAIGRTHLAGTLDQYTRDGREWVIVSDSPEECPQCRPYEGKVLSLGPDVPPPDGAPYAGTLASAIGNGLFHPNCTHRISAYVPGLTQPFGATENPEGYEQRQRQRELERRVRESKRRVEGLTPLAGTPEHERQKRLLKARREALAEHNAQHGRKQHVSDRRTSLGAR